MEQDLKVPGIQSLQTTDETSRTKRPYNKISSEIRQQILHALTVDKLSIQDVASKFQTKPCTCKAILLTYELEGRSEKKTSRRERVEIESKIRVVIVDPYGKNPSSYENTKFSKVYSEGKELTISEETNIQKKLILEVSQQLGELQTSCYHLQPSNSSQALTYNDEHAPENVLRGINMSLHLVTSKLREGQIVLNKKTQKQIKVGQKFDQDLSSQQLFDYETQSQSNYQQIQYFMKNVMTKSETNPNLFDQLKQLTSQTIIQMQILQKLQKKDIEIKSLQYQVNQIIRKYFECPS